MNCVPPGPVRTEDVPWAHIKKNMRDFYDGIVARIRIAVIAPPACKNMIGAKIGIEGGFTKHNDF